MTDDWHDDENNLPVGSFPFSLPKKTSSRDLSSHLLHVSRSLARGKGGRGWVRTVYLYTLVLVVLLVNRPFRFSYARPADPSLLLLFGVNALTFFFFLSFFFHPIFFPPSLRVGGSTERLHGELIILRDVDLLCRLIYPLSRTFRNSLSLWGSFDISDDGL